MHPLHRVALLAVFALAAPVASAEVLGNIQVFTVSQDKGSEVLVAAKKTKPGETLEYRISYKNTNKEPVKDLAVTGPVPEGTEFIAGSEKTKVKALIEYSIDTGKVFSATPTRLNKKGERVAINPSEFTTLRWHAQQALKPGEVQEYSYRVKVKTGK